MALFPYQPGLQPLGQFDAVDTEIASILGGEVMAFTAVATANSSTETSAQDQLDGYLYDTTAPVQNRAASRRAQSGDVNAFLALADDGTTGYGTAFGSTVGVPVGLSTTGTNLGPHTAVGSGKVTLWDKPGLYRVTVDALATDFVATIQGPGLTPGLTTLGYISGTGKLAHKNCNSVVASSAVAYFVDFATNSSLVTTPATLLSASATRTNVILSFNGGLGTRTLV